MARKQKHCVDYFPHDCHLTKILRIVTKKFGNDGYAFYYRLREMLGKTPKHGYDANSTMKHDYLLTKTGVDSELAVLIIELLCEFGEIDADLWKIEKLIWWQNFVDSLKELYKKRKNELPTKSEFELSVLIEKENQGTEIHKVKESI